MLKLLVHLESLLVRPTGTDPDTDPVPQGRVPRARGSAGQTTAEYALVMLGAAAIAALIVTWASKSDFVGKLFNFALSKVIGAVG